LKQGIIIKDKHRPQFNRLNIGCFGDLFIIDMETEILYAVSQIRFIPVIKINEI